MNKKLRELAELIRQPGTDEERYLRLGAFVNQRDRTRWYDRLPAPQKKLWAEVRAIITVNLTMAYESSKMTEEERKLWFPKGAYPYKWAEIEDLAYELSGERPNKSKERWIEGVKERIITSLGSSWTKERARKEVAVLRTLKSYQKEYNELADWVEREGTGE